MCQNKTQFSSACAYIYLSICIVTIIVYRLLLMHEGLESCITCTARGRDVITYNYTYITVAVTKKRHALDSIWLQRCVHVVAQQKFYTHKTY